MNVWTRLDGIALALVTLLGAAQASALPFTIATSADPADGWRSIAPVGNLEGQPLASVGLAWEAAHVGWNTSLGFDDSDAAGWHPPAPVPGGTSNGIWADEEQFDADTPAYFRLAFTLDADPVMAWFGSSAPADNTNGVDDDVQIYVNGTLLYDDQDGVATYIPIVDVTPYLHAGENLLAIKAHDSYGLNQGFAIVLQGNTIPEPATALLVTTGVLGLAASRKRRASESSWTL
jgi:hypothetical protein